MMLSEEELREIEAELAHAETRRSACIEALKIVQKHRRWVSDEAIQDLAPVLEMSPDELDNVATFYNLIFRKPVGKHIILLCDSISCWILGYERIREHLKTRLGVDFGGTSRDDEFTLLPMVCLGACDHAPVMMIDEETYLDLDPENVDRILESYRNGSDGKTAD